MSERFIDKYEIVATVGRGSMGVVYKARDPEIGRLVAIKTLKSVYMGDDPAGEEAMQRFRQESRSAGKLHHPNIVTIFEAGKTESGSPYIVMEFIEGKSLEGMVSDGGPIDPLAIIHYLGQIGSSIDYAHSQNVIHRDIKPSNIIVDANYKPFLVDFGVAKLSDTSLTPAGTVVGTPSYMSPEQIRGATLDGRTDLFSLAVVAFELFTGVRPYPGNDFTTVVSNIMHKPPRSFEELGVELPSELEQVLNKGLDKNRDERFQSALGFADSLAGVFSAVADGAGLAGGYRPGESVAKVSSSTSESLAVEASGGASVSSSSGPTAASVGAGVPEGAGSSSNGIARGDDDLETMQQTLRSDASSSGSVPSGSAGAGGSGVLKGVMVVVVLTVLFGAGYVFLWGSGAGLPIGLPGGQATEPVEVEVVQMPIEPETTAARGGTAAELSGSLKQQLPPEPPKGYSEKQLAAFSDELLLGVLALKEGIKPRSLVYAVKVAGGRPPETFASSLVVLAGHPEFIVRVEVLKAFRKGSYRQQNEVVDSILNRLTDGEFVVRGFAARALEGVNRSSVRRALETQLAVEKKDVVRSMIVKALGSIESKK